MAKKTGNVALGYVRMSVSIHPEDENSPDRQRANIQSACDKNGWQVEWYEDVGGHKSGRYESTRPEWLRLKQRLNDPDVVALVANDMSRLHRKGWKVSELIETLDFIDVALVLAAPGREVDTTTPQGRMFAQFTAIIDEFYATDISVRAKDSIAYRKAQGKTVGLPPFGTERNEDGYLIPTGHGAWLLPDGKFQSGEQGEDIPVEGAIWRGYYEAARRVLEIYTAGNIGLEKLAYRVNDEGWAFRTRKNTPRKFNRADVRRVVANWAEYGGTVRERKAKDRRAYEEDEKDWKLNPDRAVFPIELLLDVARTRSARTKRRIGHGVNRNTRVYPLSGITYCAHCERLAVQEQDARLRTRLSGAHQQIARYRHKPGVECGITNRSVPCDEYEADFRRLLDLLMVDESAFDCMLELAIDANRNMANSVDKKTLEQQKAEAIAVCNRRIEAARSVFLDGDMSREEYLRRKDQAEREIEIWESRTTKTEKISMELTRCIELVNRIGSLWDNSSPQDQQNLVNSLFEYIVFDLDARRIVDFRLKPWADRFIVLRERLHQEQDNQQSDTQGLCTELPHRGLEPLF